MSNVKTANNVSDSKTIEQRIAKIRSTFAERKRKLSAVRDAKKISQAQYEELLSVLRNKETRAVYQVGRNAKPEVLAKRKEYNRKRYEDQKSAMKRARDLGIL